MSWRDEFRQRAKVWGRGAAKEERRALGVEQEREKREAEAVEDEQMRAAWLKLPARDRTPRKPDQTKRIVCGECEGSGEELVRVKVASGRKAKWHSRTCSKCEGTGGVKVKCVACREAWIFESEAKDGKFCAMCEADTGGLDRPVSDLVVMDDLTRPGEVDPEKLTAWYEEVMKTTRCDFEGCILPYEHTGACREKLS